MNCTEVIRELSNFIDGDVDAVLKQEIELHFEGCADCRLIVYQTKKTIEVFCHCEPVELPSEVRAKLHEVLHRKLKDAAQ